jgi:hypothetical protein
MPKDFKKSKSGVGDDLIGFNKVNRSRRSKRGRSFGGFFLVGARGQWCRTLLEMSIPPIKVSSLRRLNSGKDESLEKTRQRRDRKMIFQNDALY